MRRIAAILNATAGSGPDEALARLIADAFDKRGVEAHILREVDASKLRRVARSLLDSGFDTLVAGGGDGTVSAVAAEVVSRDATLGVLPLGTLNHFAKDLGVPLDVEEAIAVICEGETRLVDVGSVNDHSFINNSSLGLYPDQVRVRQKWRDRLGKWAAMIIASFVVLTRFPYLRIIAELNGERVARRCPMVLISNNMYDLDRRNLGRRAEMDGSVLGLYLLRDEGRTGLLRVVVHSLVYSPDDAASFESYSAARIKISTRRRRVRVALDGEVFKLTSPLYYSTVPGRLRVIVPKRADRAEG
ncbi:MAG TPA: diacylglycerol kinase family protein [Blastocatellia bacterium]|nr:diacylglycerol kinase family protein [Blastocatellia bacterium]